MKWRFDTNLPIYLQIIEQMSLFIVSGDIKPGDKLPSVRELASEAGVNPNTMQRALSQLEATGLIYTNRTSGRFVTDDNEVISKTRREFAQKIAADFLSQMKILGYTDDEITEILNSQKGDDING